MKVGILTFHDVFNPGAFLQAYATQRLLESLGHQSQIIDYTPESHRFSVKNWVGTTFLRAPSQLRYAYHIYKKDTAFRVARERWLSLTSRFENREELSNEKFDAVLVGADVVWNYVIKQYGQDPVYFGAGLNTDRLVAFAPSCGPCDLNDPRPSYVDTGLQTFHHIAVRDRNTQALVEHVLGDRPVVICDPAFHLDLDNIHLECLETRPFLLVYMLGHYVDSDTARQIRAFASKRGLQVIATMYPVKWSDKNRTADGPMDWLGLLKQADYVVTNTFHGIVFCSKMKKRFGFQYTESIQSKAGHTVDSLGVQQLRIDGDRNVEDVLTCEFDFTDSHRRICSLTTDARNFLENALQ